jgi:hypothetical protein
VEAVVDAGEDVDATDAVVMVVATAGMAVEAGISHGLARINSDKT